MATIKNYKQPQSSFLSVDKDMALIVDAFLQNNRLKKLLYYQDDNPMGHDILTEEQSLELIENNSIQIIPKLIVDADVKTYIIISFDNFTPNVSNPQFRDNTISFDIICHFDQWKMINNQLRPYKIAAEIDTMFNNKHLTGIGTLQFMGCNQIIINNEFGGLTILYSAIHGGEDKNFNKDGRDLLSPEDEAQYEADFKDLYNSKEWTID